MLALTIITTAIAFITAVASLVLSIKNRKGA
ncbi:hypothetical protein SAMN05421663_101486 [Terribacillus halophilus]|uniref:Holin-like Toxin (Hol-Tox) n=1 Tax=Terribacillus halophilus TaxID=361279 RepID=A0A1G6J5Y6_9BACI|nr:hypothetical protein SAMN05421663_101486 [Terribacillus halophilus]